MRTKINVVVSLVCFSCLLVPGMHGQDAQKEIKGMIKDALGQSRETAAINDSNQKLHLRLDGKRCVINGGSNVIQIDGECSELLVNGTGNRIRVEKVDAVRVLGADNRVTYLGGVSAAKPESVRILGAGSTVAQSVGNAKSDDASTKTDSAKGENSGGAPIIIAENNNSHLTKSIPDKSPLVLSGNNNSVAITGSASSLTVTGNNNEVHIDGVEQVIFKGNNNEVYFREGKAPQTTTAGLNNAVERQE